VFLRCAIDGPDELLTRHGPAAFESVIVQLASLLEGMLQPFEVLGRYDASSFGVLLTGSTAEEAYLRAEKWRKTAAGHVAVSGGMTFSFTVSIAGCAVEADMDLEQILKLGAQALDRARADGGNCVKVV
jgi:GGDEF domain-containing protein